MASAIRARGSQHRPEHHLTSALEIDFLLLLHGYTTYHQPTTNEQLVLARLSDTVPTNYNNKSAPFFFKWNDVQLTHLHFSHQPSHNMSNDLQEYNTGQPAVNEIERGIRNTQERDQGIVPSSKQHQRDQIDRGDCAGTIPDDTSSRRLLCAIGSGNGTEHDIHGHDAHQDQRVQATGQGSHVDDGRQLELLVVTITEQGRIDEVLLDSGWPAVGRDKVPLSIATQTRQLSDVAVEALVKLVYQDDGSHEAEDQERQTGQIILHQPVKQHHGRLGFTALFDFGGGCQSDQVKGDQHRASHYELWVERTEGGFNSEASSLNR